MQQKTFSDSMVPIESGKTLSSPLKKKTFSPMYTVSVKDTEMVENTFETDPDDGAF